MTGYHNRIAHAAAIDNKEIRTPPNTERSGDSRPFTMPSPILFSQIP